MKRIWKSLLALFLFVFSFFAIVGCKKKNEPVEPTITKQTEETNVPTKTIVPTKTETKQEVKVTLDVTLSSDSIFVGESITFSLKNKEDGSTITDYQVFSSNEEVLKHENGKLVGLSEGTCEVTFVTIVNEESYSISKNITVANRPEPGTYTFVTNIPSEMFSFQKVNDVTLTLNPGNISITNFKVSISDYDILDYMSDNSIEAIDNGTAVVTFTFIYGGVEYKYEHTVTVSGELKLSVIYDKEVEMGEYVNIEVRVLPSNEVITDYTLTSSSENVYIDGTNLFASVVGNATIYLKVTYLGTTLSDTLNIKIKQPVVQVLKANINNTMFLNEEVEVECYFSPSNEVVNDFTVTTSNSDVISVSGKTIKAISAGECDIEIKLNSSTEDISALYTINVGSLEGVSLDIISDLYLNEVTFYTLFATPSDLEIYNVKYEVSNKDCLLVNNEAIFAKGLGTSTLTVSYDYLGTTYSDSVEISVTEKVYDIERIVLEGSNGVLVGTTTQLSVIKFPSDGVGEIEFLSSDENILTVNSEGLVSGVNPGKATITAKVKGTDLVQTIDIKVIEKTEEIYIDGGEYKEDHIIRYNELSKGVVQTTYWSYTKTALEGIDVDGYSGITGIIDNSLWYSQCVNILSVPSSKELKIIPWANLNGNVWNLTTVKGLIENFEKFNPGMKVIAAVNGDFFDINAEKNLPYSTTGENISDGEFYKTSNIFSPQGGTIGFTNDGSNLSLIGGYGATRTEKMILAIYNENGEIIKEFTGVSWNEEPGDNGISVWYGTYNDEQKYVSRSVSGEGLYVIENAIRAVPSYDDDFYGKGVISKISNSYDLQVGQFAIKTNNSELKEYLKENVLIRVQFEYTGDWAGVMSATGYNQKVYDDSYEVGGYEGSNLGSRAPRTVIGMKEDGTIIMMVVDGRQGAVGMYGCDGWECSAIMKAYGCVKAYNVDGGGSTTMVIRTEQGLQVLNSPSDGHERSDGNCILICSVDPNYKTYVSSTTSTEAEISVSTDVSEYVNYPTYVMCNGNLFETVNGVAKVTGLVHNQTYSYQVYYKDGEDFVKTLSVGSFTTQKSSFEFLGVVIEETDDAYIITAYCLDPDNASNMNNMNVTKNGFDTKLNNGTITLKKSMFGEGLDDLFLTFYVSSDGETNNWYLDSSDCFVIRK